MKKMLLAILLFAVSTAGAQTPAGSQDAKPAPTQVTIATQDSKTATNIIQDPKPAPAPKTQAENPAAERQADQKEFQTAAAEKNPAKKVKALEAYIKAHPKSSMTSMAQRELVAALVKVSPRRAVKWVSKYGKTADPVTRAPMYRHLAATLLKEGKAFKAAEKYASQALRDYSWEAHLAAAKKRAAGSSRPAPAEDVLRRSYNTVCADMRAVLAQVYLKQNKRDQARAMLLEAVNLDPSLADAVQSLAEMAEKQGKSEEALLWYGHAALSRPNKDRKAKFAEIYAKVKSGNNGMEEYLDAEYRRLFPPPVHAEAYQKSEKRSQRLVLAEVYTGAGCPPCVAADLAFDAILERYQRQDVAVVMYHEHIPRPDPLSNNDTVARWKFQRGRGVPTYGVDGEMSAAGGGSRDAAKEIAMALQKNIESRLEAPPEAAIQMDATRQGSTVKVTAQASGSIDSKDNVLNVLLVEKGIRYSGENGIRFHPMVVRSIASYEIQGGKAAVVHTFKQEEVLAALKKHTDDFEKFDERHNKDGSFRFMERKDTMDWTNLAVVAFVQDIKTKKILQAAWTDLSASGRKASE